MRVEVSTAANWWENNRISGVGALQSCLGDKGSQVEILSARLKRSRSEHMKLSLDLCRFGLGVNRLLCSEPTQRGFSGWQVRGVPRQDG